MTGEIATGKMETEIKVRLADRAGFTMQLPALGFHLLTAETMERNVLFDKSNGELRQRGELLARGQRFSQAGRLRGIRAHR